MLDQQVDMSVCERSAAEPNIFLTNSQARVNKGEKSYQFQTETSQAFGEKRFMNIIETLERQTKPLRAREVANALQVTRQHIYKMAARGIIPYFKVAGAIRFDPQELALWLRRRTVTAEPQQAPWLGRIA